MFDFFEQFDNNNNNKSKDGFLIDWQMPFESTKADTVFYTNGCSWLQRKHLTEAIEKNFPNVLHINSAKSGAGNLQIIEKTKRDIEFLKQSEYKIVAYISFSDVGRNKKELGLADFRNFYNINDYLKHILQTEYNILDSYLSLQQCDYCITTSFISNCFNNNARIFDSCNVQTDEQDIYKIDPSMISYIKDRNKMFNFNLQSFVDEIEKINRYLIAMNKSNRLDDTLHPIHWKCYQPVLEFLEKSIK